MKVWRIYTTSTEVKYNIYQVTAETAAQAREKFHNREAVWLDADSGDVLDESIDEIALFEDLDPIPEDMKVDEGL